VVFCGKSWARGPIKWVKISSLVKLTISRRREKKGTSNKKEGEGEGKGGRGFQKGEYREK